MQLRKSIPSILSEKHNRSCDYEINCDRFSEYDQQCSNDSLALVFSSRPIKMSPRFVLGQENVPCVAEVVNRSLKADCTDFKRWSKTSEMHEANYSDKRSFKLCFLHNVLL